MTATSIPLGDAPRLRIAGKRSRIIRLALTAALAGTAIAAFFAARAPNLSPTPLLPPGSSGIIVLDLSASVENATLDRMYAGLSQLAATNDRFGVVLVSDRAYEALPPNTPASELRPISRFFHVQPATRPRRPSPNGAAANGGAGPFNNQPAGYPRNPWTCCFSFGTEISTGLELARSIILASTSQRSVWLMSDLADDPVDRPLVTRVAKSYVNLGIALHVIALNPLKADERLFARLLGARGTLIEARPSSEVRLSSKHGFPIGLAAAAAVLALLLAANELWSTPLRWGPPRASGSVVSG